jgi:hypothetical protein
MRFFYNSVWSKANVLDAVFFRVLSRLLFRRERLDNTEFLKKRLPLDVQELFHKPSSAHWIRVWNDELWGREQT